MIKSMYTAAAGMQAQQTEVDVIANNLANVNTAGFKKSQANFEDLLYVTLQQPGATTGTGSRISGLEVGSGSRLVATSKVFSEGVLHQTAAPLDLAISGDGFFEVAGPGGERYFTRDGHFLRDGNGAIVTAQGLKLTPAITLPQDASQITITKDGVVSYRQDDTNVEVGQLTLVRFSNPSGLASEGGNLFSATSNSGDPVTIVPGEEGAGQVIQGFVERSNVDIANELISLIIAQRAYETNSRAIRTADEMLRTVNQIRQ